jgi:type I restriction enzyme S subunit
MKDQVWDLTTLGQEIDLLTGYPFASKDYTESEYGIRLLRGANIGQGKLKWENAKRWPADKVEGLEPYYLACDDVVLAMDRPWIEAGLKYASISKHDLPCLLVQRVARLRGRENLDTRFLRYLIGSARFTNHVLAVQTGTAVPHISGKQIKEFAFDRPPLPEQRAIAEILGSLDDKIELNRRMNATLEGIARAIFTSWFVDFDPVHAKARGETPAGMDAATAALFPDVFVESELGPIPAGWEVVKMKALVSLDHNRLTPQDYAEETFDYFSIPAYKEDGMPELEVGAEIRSSKYLVPEGCVLLSRLNPRFPRVWLPFLEGNYRATCSTEFLVVMPKAGMIREYLYTLFNMDNFRHRFENLVTGTSGSHQRVKQRSFLNMRVVKPPTSVVDAFTDLARPIYEKIAQNQFESQTLAELRDTLLPKLISGELRVDSVVK